MRAYFAGQFRFSWTARSSGNFVSPKKGGANKPFQPIISPSGAHKVGAEIVVLSILFEEQKRM
jgi:hypothetical protein